MPRKPPPPDPRTVRAAERKLAGLATKAAAPPKPPGRPPAKRGAK
jgi:hypothetical protein